MVAYAHVLKTKGLKFAYIDAFAGSGEHRPRKKKRDELQPSLFEEEQRAFALGSARIALESEPTFDKYIFIEKKASNVAQLRKLVKEYPALEHRVDIHQGDANAFLQNLTGPKYNWSENRALVFLDPYGMKVDWPTVAGLAGTRAVDMWYLFPLGQALNRLVTRDGNIPPEWEAAITRVLGVPRKVWEPEFYRDVEIERTSLFDDPDQDDPATKRVRVTIEAVGQFVVMRLASVFAGVVKPLALRNRTGMPLFLLCFAAANPAPKAKETACKIADQILSKMRAEEGGGLRS